MRTPAALFPFVPELLPAVKFFEGLQDKYTLRKLFSTPGSGLTGRDAGYSRNHPQVGMTVSDELDPADPTWDTLILTRTLGTEAIDNAQLESAAVHALRLGKSVLYFHDKSTNLPETIRSLSEAYPDKIEIHGRGSHTLAISTFDSGKYSYTDACCADWRVGGGGRYL